MRVAACVGVAGAVLAFPIAAQARTKVVDMGLPANQQNTFNSRGTDVNDFFPHGVTIHVGDSVKFVPTGFHSVDLPNKGGAPLPLITPTGSKVAGVTDAAGVPFWFNGQDQLGFNPALFASGFGKHFRYNGSARRTSGLPVAPSPKPMVVKFTKVGKYRFFCNVHTGMTGTVRVRHKGKRIPTARQDRKALKKQLKRDLKIAKRLASNPPAPPAGTVDVGVAGAHGVEFFGMFPNTLTVPAGTTLKFRMTPGSLEVHTATFGPQDYRNTLANSFNGAVIDPRAAYPSDLPGTVAVLTKATHGNGFWNSGVMDRSSKTPLGSFNVVKFGAAGTYTYQCLIHTFMTGTIKVT